MYIRFCSYSYVHVHIHINIAPGMLVRAQKAKAKRHWKAVKSSMVAPEESEQISMFGLVARIPGKLTTLPIPTN